MNKDREIWISMFHDMEIRLGFKFLKAGRWQRNLEYIYTTQYIWQKFQASTEWAGRSVSANALLHKTYCKYYQEWIYKGRN